MVRPDRSSVAVADRRQIVERLYLEGIDKTRILSAVRRECGPTTERIIESDINHIRKRWKAQALHIFSDDVESWWVQIALADRRAAIKDGDLRLAYTIAKDIAKMAGVNLADLVVEHRTGIGGPTTWLDLMQYERKQKQLPPADFEVVADDDDD